METKISETKSLRREKAEIRKNRIRESDVPEEISPRWEPVKLGQGCFGTVVATSPCIATKEIANIKYFTVELFWMSYVKNIPGFVELKGINLRKQTLDMVRYESNLGEMAEKIKFVDRIRLADSILRQLLDALLFLHKRGIVHGDVKLENIMCNLTKNESGEIDGICCFLGDFSTTAMCNYITLYDFATFRSKEPRSELLDNIFFDKSKNITHKMQSDLWAIGLLVVSFLMKGHIAIENFEGDNYYDIKKGYPGYFNTLSDYAYDMICGLTSLDAGKRNGQEEFYKSIAKGKVPEILPKNFMAGNNFFIKSLMQKLRKNHKIDTDMKTFIYSVVGMSAYNMEFEDFYEDDEFVKRCFLGFFESTKICDCIENL